MIGSPAPWLRPRTFSFALISIVLVLGACTSEEPDDVSEGTEQVTDPEAGVAEDEEGGSLTSAREGPEGQRTLDVIPDEIPASIAPDDARDIEGRTARSGDDWSVSVSFNLDGERQAAARAVDQRISDDGFELHRRIIETERVVSIYDGPGGLVMTVTVVPTGEQLQLSANIIG